MKATTSKSQSQLAGFVVAAGLLGLALAAENAAAIEKSSVTVVAATGAKAETPAPPAAPGTPAPPAKPGTIVIQAIEPVGAWKTSKETTWLGVSTEEVPEALASQLGFNSGEGLVVNYVATDSPAAKAGFKKNDVLVEFGDQLLVHPAQLRKLVQSRKEGDTVSLTIYRAGKKEMISVTLARTATSTGSLFDERILEDPLSGLHHQLGELKLNEALRKDEMKALHDSLMKSGFDKEQLSLEIKRGLEQARKAILDAMRQASNVHGVFGPAAKELEAFARAEADAERGSTVVVKKDRKSVKAIVKTDDSGTYVIVAGPKKHLTVHDKDGKLIFDGEIDTPEKQEKVPKEVWEKVKPMLEEMGKPKASQSEGEADSDEDPNS